MTKAELEIKVKELEDQIKEYEHLSSAVNAKDREISNLLKEKETFIEKATNKFKDERDSAIKNIEERYKEEIARLTKLVERRESELNVLINIYGGLLKTIQGTLDNNIELNNYFIQGVTR